MVEPRRLKHTWLVGPLLFAALTASSVASARSLEVRDEAHVLSSDDIARLRSDVASAPFDVRFVMTTAHAESQELAHYLEPFVSRPDMIVVGVDPDHHHVQVRFGTGSHVPETSWHAIEKSGNDGFRHGDWEGGAAAIVHAAADAVSTSPPSLVNPEPRAEPSGAGPGMVFLVLGGFVALALVASFFFRRRGMQPPMGGGYGPPYGGGGYGYGPQPGGMGPVGGGLLGAGLGGLAGYEIGKLEGEREERGRDQGFSGDNPRNDEGNGNYDAGGGGSDWDSGGGGSDGGDSGGGGGGSDF